MSVQAALQFIHQVRKDGALRQSIESVEGHEGHELEYLAALGARWGLEFSPEELRTAHAHDWRMRWYHYHTRDTYREFSRMSEPLPT